MTEIEQVWRRKSDEEVLDAMAHIEEYRSPAQSAIRAEHLRRGLPPPRLEEPEEDSERPATDEDELAEDVDPLLCTRCQENLEYVGSKKFHEGTNWGVLGELGELFVKRERFDVYMCPRCGKVEFFVDGVGEELRPQ